MREFIRTRLRRALVGIPLIIALLAMMVSVTGCQSLFKPAAAAPRTKAVAALPKRVPTGAEKFASATTSLTVSLDAAAKALKSGKRDGIALKGVADFAAALPKLNAGVQADFAKTRGVLAKIKSPAKDAIEAKVEKQYAEREAMLAEKLAAVGSATTASALSAAIGDASRWLASITPTQPYRPLGTQLPHRIVNAHAGSPILGTSIAPAYAPNTKGGEPSDLPITPTDADTSTTVEVQFTDDIRSLATSLGNDPVRMYEYVRNTIDFEPYYGSRKGASETFLEGSGNDIDTASLLIALYRVSGIPARYVSGVVDIPIAKAENWVGVETPEAAAKLFSAAGTPCRTVISGGKITALRIDHTWTEVYVPYEDYRGAGAGTGAKRWVALDGSWKTYQNNDGLASLSSSLNESATALAAVSFQSSDGAAVGSFDATASQAEFAKISAESTHVPGYSTDAVMAAAIPRRVRKITQAVLPGQLAVSAEPNAEWQRVPVDLAESIELSLGGSSTTTVPVAALKSGLLHLSFQYASAVDTGIGTQAANLSDLPPYLVRLRPVVETDGAAIIIGQGSFSGGEAVDCRVGIVTPGFQRQDVAVPVIASGQYSIMIDRGNMPASRLRQSRDALESDASADVGQSSPNTQVGAIRDVSTRTLDGAMQTYFLTTDAVRARCAAVMKVAAVSLTSVGVAGLDISSDMVLGQAIRLTPRGLFMDVRGLNSAAQATDDRAGWRLPYGIASGTAASLAESAAWDVMYPGIPGAISTAKVFADSLSHGIPLAYLDQSNAETVLANLPYAESVKKGLLDEVHTGYAVVIPMSLVYLDTNPEVGYIVLDTTSGSTGFMISRQYAGSDKMFPTAGPSTAVGAFWDVASSLALIPGVFLSTGAAALLAIGLALPSIAMLTISFIGFINWVTEKGLPTFMEAGILMQAVTLYVGLVAAAMVSAFLPLPEAILMQIGCSVLGTSMFMGLLPIEVEIGVWESGW